MCGFRRRLLKGSWLQLIVLRVLYEKPQHGYKLLQEVNTLLAGRKKLNSGSLYTILRRLEHSGLLNSTWEKKSAGLDRRIYTLTQEGVAMLRQGKGMIEEQRRVLEEMTEFYQQHFRDEYDE
jgi:DNA-binding PadR family transcriptional regulator